MTTEHMKPMSDNIRIEKASTLHGTAVEGYQVAFDKETKMTGVVKENTFFPTLPLNGHRGRDLAETVFGIRSVDEWYLDRVAIVDAKIIQGLPDWDRYNQAFADSFTGMVMVQAVYRIPSYGVHIRVSQV